MPAQDRLLRATEYGEITRIGASKPISVDVRIVAATNENLPSQVDKGKFRADLLDRLSFEVITLPPLRERPEDIHPLVIHFLEHYKQKTGRFVSGISREALRALRRRAVLRWLVLLQLGDFTYDILRGFLALYFVDVVGAGEGGAALAVAVWTWVGLAGDFAVVPLLERVRGLSYLRVSTAAVLVLFPLMLLAEGFSTKLLLLGLLGLANAGWYAIIQAKVYDELPGQSGTVAMTLGNVVGLASSLAPLALGAYAEAYGLASMMWLLALGPVALLIGLLTVKESRQ